MKTTKELLKELREKHIKIKSKMLDLTTQSETNSMSKQKMRDEIFKIYKEIK